MVGCLYLRTEVVNETINADCYRCVAFALYTTSSIAATFMPF